MLMLPYRSMEETPPVAPPDTLGHRPASFPGRLSYTATADRPRWCGTSPAHPAPACASVLCSYQPQLVFSVVVSPVAPVSCMLVPVARQMTALTERVQVVVGHVVFVRVRPMSDRQDDA